MAATAVTLGYTPEKGINYTYVTDSSADWGAVPNTTYFYNKADKLPYYKDGTGTVLSVFSASGASGKFGIPDSSGAYTYYSTLNAAMTAAVSGQTIEMFTDYTETGATEITLKDGVNINGNGHTYTKNTNDATHILITTAGVNINCSINNLTFVRSVGTGKVFQSGPYTLGNSNIDFTGTIMKNTGSSGAFESIDINVFNLIAMSYGVSNALAFNTGRIKNCIGINFSSGRGFFLFGNGGTAEQCFGESNSGDGFYNDGRAINCTGYSSSGTGFVSLNYAQNCTGRSISSTGFAGYYDTVEQVDCIGTSISGIGFVSAGGNASGCTGFSQGNYGTTLSNTCLHSNFTSISSAAPAIWSLNSTNSELINGYAACRWNNASGYGLRGWGGLMPSKILNVTFKLNNASAPYLYNDGIAASLSLRGNTYLGGAVYNANLTQAIVATQDNQGNIFL